MLLPLTASEACGTLDFSDLQFLTSLLCAFIEVNNQRLETSLLPDYVPPSQ